MIFVRDPILQSVPIMNLRPTQITVGMREVRVKRKSWRTHGAKKRLEFLAKHAVPVILGSKERLYIVDHHHLARALHDEGVNDILVMVFRDLSRISQESFWTFLDHHGWVYPYDEKGRRCDYKKIPRSVAELKDDPYRSLAGELRRIGGFAKDTTPFSEFLWADFLREPIGKASVKNQYKSAIKKAYKLAKSSKANYLPGWCGPVGA
jgi:hypothetical protein